MGKLTNHKTLVFLVLFFLVVYALISLINHYTFRTYALDLGAYTNALYDYSHFQWNDSGVFKMINENLLADHFDLYLILFSPFSFVLGTYTLLVVQIVAILFGGIGIYVLFQASQKTFSLALYATLFFYSFFGVFAALSFDYHSNVVAAALVPWFFYLIQKEKLRKSFLLLLFILISKENISLWMIFVCLGIAMEYRKTHYLRNYLIGFALFSGVYFVSITSFIMPFISNSGEYAHFHYSILGGSFSEAFQYLLSHPINSIKTLFINHSGNASGDYVKMELHLFLLFSGLPFLFWKPQYIFMLLPIYFQKLFHDYPEMWGIAGQYSIEFMPIMAIGIFMVIAEIKKKRLKKGMAFLVLFFTISTTVRSMDHTIYYTNKARIRFYQQKHYQRNYNIRNVHKQLSNIPKEAIVSVQSPFLPHLALRDKVYQFPIIKDADYIIYSEKEKSYLLSQESFDSLCSQLEHSPKWHLIYDKNIKILKRNKNNS